MEISSVANDDSVEDYDDSGTVSIGYPGGGATLFTSGQSKKNAVTPGTDSATEKSFKTREYGSIVDGTQVTFSGVDFFFGDVMNRVAGHIECWEADDS
ncbi:hypothetical protein EYC80_008204 [Monilinia laxa]|uniref:Uncharacterized protein n=1 Tax=Monilinia laxa TaxID=61186 RepID=A0A5N6JTU3_MONLA|nr:hypothetical protein EYC80_008204 [Monilinia laxa]